MIIKFVWPATPIIRKEVRGCVSLWAATVAVAIILLSLSLSELGSGSLILLPSLRFTVTKRSRVLL